MRVVTGCDENLGLVGLGEIAAELVVADVIFNLNQKAQFNRDLIRTAL